MSIKPLPLRPAHPSAYERCMTGTAHPASNAEMLKAEVAGHRLEVIFNGEQRLERLLALINGAIRSVDMIMYIFRPDRAGTRVSDINH